MKNLSTILVEAELIGSNRLENGDTYGIWLRWQSPGFGILD